MIIDDYTTKISTSYFFAHASRKGTIELNLYCDMAVTMEGHGLPTVDAFAQLLLEMLQQAELVKHTHTVESPLNKTDLANTYEQIDQMFNESASVEAKKRSQYAIIETAVRDTFNNLLVSLAPVRARNTL